MIGLFRQILLIDGQFSIHMHTHDTLTYNAEHHKQQNILMYIH